MCTATSQISETDDATSINHTYRVKIINPSKSDFIIRTLHHFRGKFDSILALKMKLMESFPNNVPTTTDFQVGYLEGKQSSKRWLMCSEDLESMYSLVWQGNEISLWCDAYQKAAQMQPTPRTQRNDGDGPSGISSRKRTASNREEREIEINSLKSEIKKKHPDIYSDPQVSVWARMISNGIHDSTDIPPDIPIITGAVKRKKEPSRSVDKDALTAITTATTAAVSALADAVSSRSSGSKCESPPRTADSGKPVGLSPGRMIELRMKNYEQLRYVQKLYEDNIITEAEFIEQKALILKTIREFV